MYSCTVIDRVDIRKCRADRFNLWLLPGRGLFLYLQILLSALVHEELRYVI